MKRVIKIICAVILSAAVLTACGQKELTPKDIEGTWETFLEGSVVSDTIIYTFKSDFTYTESFTASSEVIALGHDEKGTYTFVGNVLAMKDEYGEISTYAVSMRDGKMVFTLPNGKEQIYTKK